MKKRKLLITFCLMTLVLMGCNANESTQGDSPQNSKLDMFKLDFQDDVYFLMGIDYSLLQKIIDTDAVDIYEKDSEERMSEHYYQLKNGVSIRITGNQVISVGTFYYDDSIEHPAPSLFGINGDDDYESVISKLGTPYYDDPESTPPSVVYLVRYMTYVKIFFDSETGKVSYISCFQE